MLRGVANFILVFILAEITTAFIFNESLIDDYDNTLKENNITDIKTRRQAKSESTSSEGKRDDKGEAKADDDKESLEQSFSVTSSDSTEEKKKSPIKKKSKKDRAPKSTVERHGWRKWHRKCTPCPEDMHKKWRDPSIKWICGAYQRARRTFKSLCMMHYRNCQDGTMFTKIADHRCPDAVRQIRPYNLHFFYDYSVVLSDDTETRSDGSDTADEKSSSSFSELDNIPIKF